MSKEEEMGGDLTGKLESFAGDNAVAMGVARTVEGAIHVAWARVEDTQLKQDGLQVTLVVGGGNPIGWYGVILSTSS